jgi:hypothetical protein
MHFTTGIHKNPAWDLSMYIYNGAVNELIWYNEPILGMGEGMYSVYR